MPVLLHFILRRLFPDSVISLIEILDKKEFTYIIFTFRCIIYSFLPVKPKVENDAVLPASSRYQL